MKMYDSSLDASNPAARIPCVVALDCSWSMHGKPIAALNEGLNRFFAEVRADDAAAMSTETAIVRFDTTAKLVHGFASVFDYPETLEPFTAEGSTATGPALELSERLLNARLAQYRSANIPHYAPWLIVLTDGRPCPDKGWKEPVSRLKRQAAEGRLTYLCIGVGDNIDTKTLAELSADELGCVYLKDLRFSEFFSWLSSSMHDVSAAGLSGQDDVRLRGMNAWARMMNPKGKAGV